MSDVVRKTAEAILGLSEADHGPYILSCYGPGEHRDTDVTLTDLKALARAYLELEKFYDGSTTPPLPESHQND